MRTTALLLTTTLLLAVPIADARWQKPFTMSGFPEVNIAEADRSRIVNTLTNGLMNRGCSMVQEQGASIIYECSKEVMDYRERLMFNLTTVPNGSRIIMRNFLFTTKPDRPGGFSYYFDLNTNMEITQQKKSFMGDMAFLESLKHAVEQQTSSQKYPSIGIHMATLTPTLSKQLKLPVKEGIFIRDIQPGSPADKAGIKAGDVIQEINGAPVTQAEEAQRQVRATKNGTVVHLQIQRQKEQLEFQIVPTIPE